ncbi:substrate-binding domain-containing protein [Laribacter hongkongensis]|uniref:substrate-binding domain-containing protein n=1 Tax=Laribacter hongkongensis TaxID=168471 RepID=UPI0023D90C8B
MSKLMKSLMAGALVFAVAACSKQGPETAQAPDAGTDGGKPAIGLAVSTQSNPFFVTLKKGAEEEAQKQGLTLITVDAQDDPAKQIASIEDLIQKKVKVILVNPTDSDAVVGAVKAAPTQPESRW